MNPRNYTRITVDPNDHDPRPRLELNGCGIHAGECIEILDDNGKWLPVCIEMSHEKKGPGAWYVSGHSNIQLIGRVARWPE